MRHQPPPHLLWASSNTRVHNDEFRARRLWQVVSGATLLQALHFLVCGEAQKAAATGGASAVAATASCLAAAAAAAAATGATVEAPGGPAAPPAAA